MQEDNNVFETSIDSGISIDIGSPKQEEEKSVTESKMTRFQEILFILERDKLLRAEQRKRLSQLAERRQRKKRAEDPCNVCCKDLDLDNIRSSIKCVNCQKPACRGQSCSVWIPSRSGWECHLCNQSQESISKSSEWLNQQVTGRFLSPLSARSEPALLRDHLSPTEPDRRSEAASSFHGDQKERVREMIEETLAEMLGGSLDNISVNQLYKSRKYLPTWENGEEPGMSHIKLKRLIEKIINDTLRLPNFTNEPLTPGPTNDQSLPFFDPKKYQELLATAVLNKIVDSYNYEQKFDSNRDAATDCSDLDRNHNALIGRKVQSDSISSSSIEPESDCSVTDPLTNVSRFGDFSRSDSGSNLFTDAFNRNEQRDSSMLTDYLAKHNVPLPDFAIDSDSSNEDHLSEPKNLDESWEGNWLFKKKRMRQDASCPVGMLVPCPKEDIKTQIGDKTADELSDLSEAGSDCEDNNNIDEIEDTPPNALIQNRNIIGGKSPLGFFDELLEQTSLVSVSSVAEGDAVFTETKNEYVLGDDMEHDMAHFHAEEAINSLVDTQKIQNRLSDSKNPEKRAGQSENAGKRPEARPRSVQQPPVYVNVKEIPESELTSSSTASSATITESASESLTNNPTESINHTNNNNHEEEEGISRSTLPEHVLKKIQCSKASAIQFLAVVALAPSTAIPTVDTVHFDSIVQTTEKFVQQVEAETEDTASDSDANQVDVETISPPEYLQEMESSSGHDVFIPPPYEFSSESEVSSECENSVSTSRAIKVEVRSFAEEESKVSVYEKQILDSLEDISEILKVQTETNQNVATFGNPINVTENDKTNNIEVMNVRENEISVVLDPIDSIHDLVKEQNNEINQDFCEKVIPTESLENKLNEVSFDEVADVKLQLPLDSVEKTKNENQISPKEFGDNQPSPKIPDYSQGDVSEKLKALTSQNESNLIASEPASTSVVQENLNRDEEENSLGDTQNLEASKSSECLLNEEAIWTDNTVESIKVHEITLVPVGAIDDTKQTSAETRREVLSEEDIKTPSTNMPPEIIGYENTTTASITTSGKQIDKSEADGKKIDQKISASEPTREESSIPMKIETSCPTGSETNTEIGLKSAFEDELEDTQNKDNLIVENDCFSNAEMDESNSTFAKVLVIDAADASESSKKDLSSEGGKKSAIDIHMRNECDEPKVDENTAPLVPVIDEVPCEVAVPKDEPALVIEEALSAIGTAAISEAGHIADKSLLPSTVCPVNEMKTALSNESSDWENNIQIFSCKEVANSAEEADDAKSLDNSSPSQDTAIELVAKDIIENKTSQEEAKSIEDQVQRTSSDLSAEEVPASVSEEITFIEKLSPSMANSSTHEVSIHAEKTLFELINTGSELDSTDPNTTSAENQCGEVLYFSNTGSVVERKVISSVNKLTDEAQDIFLLDNEKPPDTMVSSDTNSTSESSDAVEQPKENSYHVNACENENVNANQIPLELNENMLKSIEESCDLLEDIRPPVDFQMNDEKDFDEAAEISSQVSVLAKSSCALVDSLAEFSAASKTSSLCIIGSELASAEVYLANTEHAATVEVTADTVDEPTTADAHIFSDETRAKRKLEAEKSAIATEENISVPPEILSAPTEIISASDEPVLVSTRPEWLSAALKLSSVEHDLASEELQQTAIKDESVAAKPVTNITQPVLEPESESFHLNSPKICEEFHLSLKETESVLEETQKVSSNMLLVLKENVLILTEPASASEVISIDGIPDSIGNEASLVESIATSSEPARSEPAIVTADLIKATAEPSPVLTDSTSVSGADLVFLPESVLVLEQDPIVLLEPAPVPEKDRCVSPEHSMEHTQLAAAAATPEVLTAEPELDLVVAAPISMERASVVEEAIVVAGEFPPHITAATFESALAEPVPVLTEPTSVNEDALIDTAKLTPTVPRYAQTTLESTSVIEELVKAIEQPVLISKEPSPTIMEVPVVSIESASAVFEPTAIFEPPASDNGTETPAAAANEPKVNTTQIEQVEKHALNFGELTVMSTEPSSIHEELTPAAEDPELLLAKPDLTETEPAAMRKEDSEVLVERTVTLTANKTKSVELILTDSQTTVETALVPIETIGCIAHQDYLVVRSTSPARETSAELAEDSAKCISVCAEQLQVSAEIESLNAEHKENSVEIASAMAENAPFTERSQAELTKHAFIAFIASEVASIEPVLIVEESVPPTIETILKPEDTLRISANTSSAAVEVAPHVSEKATTPIEAMPVDTMDSIALTKSVSMVEEATIIPVDYAPATTVDEQTSAESVKNKEPTNTTEAILSDFTKLAFSEAVLASAQPMHISTEYKHIFEEFSRAPVDFVKTAADSKKVVVQPAVTTAKSPTDTEISALSMEKHSLDLDECTPISTEDVLISEVPLSAPAEPQLTIEELESTSEEKASAPVKLEPVAHEPAIFTESPEFDPTELAPALKISDSVSDGITSNKAELAAKAAKHTHSTAQLEIDDEIEMEELSAVTTESVPFTENPITVLNEIVPHLEEPLAEPLSDSANHESDLVEPAAVESMPGVAATKSVREEYVSMVAELKSAVAAIAPATIPQIIIDSSEKAEQQIHTLEPQIISEKSNRFASEKNDNEQLPDETENTSSKPESPPASEEAIPASVEQPPIFEAPQSIVAESKSTLIRSAAAATEPETLIEQFKVAITDPKSITTGNSCSIATETESHLSDLVPDADKPSETIQNEPIDDEFTSACAEIELVAAESLPLPEEFRNILAQSEIVFQETRLNPEEISPSVSDVESVPEEVAVGSVEPVLISVQLKTMPLPIDAKMEPDALCGSSSEKSTTLPIEIESLAAECLLDPEENIPSTAETVTASEEQIQNSINIASVPSEFTSDFSMPSTISTEEIVELKLKLETVEDPKEVEEHREINEELEVNEAFETSPVSTVTNNVSEIAMSLPPPADNQLTSNTEPLGDFTASVQKVSTIDGSLDYVETKRAQINAKIKMGSNEVVGKDESQPKPKNSKIHSEIISLSETTDISTVTLNSQESAKPEGVSNEILREQPIFIAEVNSERILSTVAEAPENTITPFVAESSNKVEIENVVGHIETPRDINAHDSASISGNNVVPIEFDEPLPAETSINGIDIIVSEPCTKMNVSAIDSVRQCQPETVDIQVYETMKSNDTVELATVTTQNPPNSTTETIENIPKANENNLETKESSAENAAEFIERAATGCIVVKTVDSLEIEQNDKLQEAYEQTVMSNECPVNEQQKQKPAEESSERVHNDEELSTASNSHEVPEKRYIVDPATEILAAASECTKTALNDAVPKLVPGVYASILQEQELNSVETAVLAKLKSVEVKFLHDCEESSTILTEAPILLGESSEVSRNPSSPLNLELSSTELVPISTEVALADEEPTSVTSKAEPTHISLELDAPGPMKLEKECATVEPKKCTCTTPSDEPSQNDAETIPALAETVLTESHQTVINLATEEQKVEAISTDNIENSERKLEYDLRKSDELLEDPLVMKNDVIDFEKESDSEILIKTVPGENIQTEQQQIVSSENWEASNLITVKTETETQLNFVHSLLIEAVIEKVIEDKVSAEAPQLLKDSTEILSDETSQKLGNNTESIRGPMENIRENVVKLDPTEKEMNLEENTLAEPTKNSFPTIIVQTVDTSDIEPAMTLNESSSTEDISTYETAPSSLEPLCCSPLVSLTNLESNQENHVSSNNQDTFSTLPESEVRPTQDQNNGADMIDIERNSGSPAAAEKHDRGIEENLVGSTENIQEASDLPLDLSINFKESKDNAEISETSVFYNNLVESIETDGELSPQAVERSFSSLFFPEDSIPETCSPDASESATVPMRFESELSQSNEKLVAIAAEPITVPEETVSLAAESKVCVISTLEAASTPTVPEFSTETLSNLADRPNMSTERNIFSEDPSQALGKIDLRSGETLSIFEKFAPVFSGDILQKIDTTEPVRASTYSELLPGEPTLELAEPESVLAEPPSNPQQFDETVLEIQQQSTETNSSVNPTMQNFGEACEESLTAFNESPAANNIATSPFKFNADAIIEELLQQIDYSTSPLYQLEDPDDAMFVNPDYEPISSLPWHCLVDDIQDINEVESDPTTENSESEPELSITPPEIAMCYMTTTILEPIPEDIELLVTQSWNTPPESVPLNDDRLSSNSQCNEKVKPYQSETTFGTTESQAFAKLETNPENETNLDTTQQEDMHLSSHSLNNTEIISDCDHIQHTDPECTSAESSTLPTDKQTSTESSSTTTTTTSVETVRTAIEIPLDGQKTRASASHEGEPHKDSKVSPTTSPLKKPFSVSIAFEVQDTPTNNTNPPEQTEQNVTQTEKSHSNGLSSEITPLNSSTTQDTVVSNDDTATSGDRQYTKVKLLKNTAFSRRLSDDEDSVQIGHLSNLLPGSIAEREHKKWYNAVEMPNNPYSKEALKRRLSTTSEKPIDIPNINSPLEKATSEDQVNRGEDEHDVANDTKQVEYRRYGRDYYINDAKYASGSSKQSKLTQSLSLHGLNVDADQSSVKEQTLQSQQQLSSSLSSLSRSHSWGDKQQHSSKNVPGVGGNGSVHIGGGSRSSSCDIFTARPVRVEESDPILSKATKLEYLSTAERDFYLLPTEEISSLRSISASEHSLSQAGDSLTPSEDSDTIRVYDLKTQQTRLIREDDSVSPVPAVKELIDTNITRTHRQQQLGQSPVNLRPHLLTQRSLHPTSNINRSSTPTAFRFLQPKRKLYDSRRVMSEDMAAVYDRENLSRTNGTPEKSVIEEDVIPALPSVKALTKVFQNTSQDAAGVQLSRPKSYSWKSVDVKTKEELTPTTQEATPVSAQPPPINEETRPEPEPESSENSYPPLYDQTYIPAESPVVPPICDEQDKYTEPSVESISVTPVTGAESPQSVAPAEEPVQSSKSVNFIDLTTMSQPVEDIPKEELQSPAEPCRDSYSPPYDQKYIPAEAPVASPVAAETGEKPTEVKSDELNSLEWKEENVEIIPTPKSDQQSTPPNTPNASESENVKLPESEPPLIEPTSLLLDAKEEHTNEFIQTTETRESTIVEKFIENEKRTSIPPATGPAPVESAAAPENDDIRIIPLKPTEHAVESVVPETDTASNIEPVFATVSEEAPVLSPAPEVVQTTPPPEVAPIESVEPTPVETTSLLLNHTSADQSEEEKPAVSSPEPPIAATNGLAVDTKPAQNGFHEASPASPKQEEQNETTKQTVVDQKRSEIRFTQEQPLQNRPISPVLVPGKLKSSIAFFENLKNQK